MDHETQSTIVGIDLNAVTQQLEDEGADQFMTASNSLLASLEEKQAALHGLSENLTLKTHGYMGEPAVLHFT